MNAKFKKMKVKDTCSNNGSNGANKTINFRGFGAMISRHTKSRSSFVIRIRKGYSCFPPLWKAKHSPWTLTECWSSVPCILTDGGDLVGCDLIGIQDACMHVWSVSSTSDLDGEYKNKSSVDLA